MTNEILDLVRKTRASFPLASVEADPPIRDRGTHHIDIRLGDRFVVVEWSERLGFGISLILEAALDGGPDFRVSDAGRAFGIVKLLLSEAQDADFGEEVGDWATETEGAIEYRDLAVTERERRAPRRRAA